MATAFLSPIGNGIVPFFTSQGVVLAGGQLFTYQAGTTTPQATWTTQSQSVQNANPIILGSNGLPPQEIWLQQGQAYKFVLEDANGNVLATYDNISGINDTSNSPAEWTTSPLAPTYVSATQFTLPGNQTANFPAGQRIKAQVSAGVVYGTVSSSSFGSVTTVNVFNDSGALDSGLASVAYSLLSASHSSTPPNSTATAHVFAQNSSAQSITGSVANITGWTTVKDSLGNFNASTGTFTAPTTGYYYVKATFAVTGTFSVNNEIQTDLVANGSNVSVGRLISLASATTLGGNTVDGLVFLSAGQTVNIQMSQNSGNAAALTNTAIQNWLSIFQVP